MPVEPFVRDTLAALLSDVTGGRTDIAAREATGGEPSEPRSPGAEMIAKLLPFLLLGAGGSALGGAIGRDSGRRATAAALQDQERALTRLEKLAVPMAERELLMSRGSSDPASLARLRAASDQLETAALGTAPVQAMKGPGMAERLTAPFVQYGAGPAAFLGGEALGEDNPELGAALKLGGAGLMLGAGAPTAYRRGVERGSRGMLREADELAVMGRGIRDEHALSQVPQVLNRPPRPEVEGVRQSLAQAIAGNERRQSEAEVGALLRRQKAEAEAAAAQRYADAGETLSRTARGWESESRAERTRRLTEARDRISRSREIVRTTDAAQDTLRQIATALEAIEGKRAKRQALVQATTEFNREHGTGFTWKTLRQEINKYR